MKQHVLWISLLFLTTLQAQESLRFQISLDGEKIELEQRYAIRAYEDSLSFEVIKFYLSDISFYQNDQWVYSVKKKHHLIDLEKPETLVLPISEVDELAFDQLRFTLGVDSLTNVSGAFGGDLDPTNGMYWTWQSGYINTKIEGIADNCPARHHRFQFHVGGYQAPYATARQIIVPITHADDLQIDIAIDKFLTQIDLTKQYQIMSPNQQAFEISHLLTAMFSSIQ